MTNREQVILRVLSSVARTFTVEQIAVTWWNDAATGLHRARTALSRLQASGWLTISRVLARPVVSMTGPIYRWCPDCPEPDFEGSSQVLRSRSAMPARLVTICMASSKAHNLFGIGKRISVKLTQLTHELQVSELYLQHRKNGFQNHHWLNDSRLPRDWRLKVRPDVLIVDDFGNYVRAIEYGGDYLPERLEALHEGLASIELEYEVW